MTLEQQLADCRATYEAGVKRLQDQKAELLSACKRLLALWEEAIDRDPDYMSMADFARKAIARAEGGKE